MDISIKFSYLCGHWRRTLRTYMPRAPRPRLRRRHHMMACGPMVLRAAESARQHVRRTKREHQRRACDRRRPQRAHAAVALEEAFGEKRDHESRRLVRTAAAHVVRLPCAETAVRKKGLVPELCGHPAAGLDSTKYPRSASSRFRSSASGSSSSWQQTEIAGCFVSADESGRSVFKLIGSKSLPNERTRAALVVCNERHYTKLSNMYNQLNLVSVFILSSFFKNRHQFLMGFKILFYVEWYLQFAEAQLLLCRLVSWKRHQCQISNNLILSTQ